MPGTEPFNSLLSRDEPLPFEQRGESRGRPLLVVCDHASRRIPRALGGLGLPEAALERHIAWDIGAGELAVALAERLEAAVILAGYSRLVIDCNRRLEDPSSIAVESDGQVIPGNAHLTQAERALRARTFFSPYHQAIESTLARHAQAGRVPTLISIHSFTPSMNGFSRPWHCGVLWDLDGRIAGPLLAALRSDDSLVVGDNEPYSGRHPTGYTVGAHAQSRGWPHVSVEIRQDLIASPATALSWADRLSRALEPILAEESFGFGPRGKAALSEVAV